MEGAYRIAMLRKDLVVECLVKDVDDVQVYVGKEVPLNCDDEILVGDESITNNNSPGINTICLY